MMHDARWRENNEVKLINHDNSFLDVPFVEGTRVYYLVDGQWFAARNEADDCFRVLLLIYVLLVSPTTICSKFNSKSNAGSDPSLQQ
jgi:hypothetical protein